MGRAVRAKRTGAMVAVHEVRRERGGGVHLESGKEGWRGEKETREEEGRGMWIRQPRGGPHLEREGRKEEVSVRDASA